MGGRLVGVCVRNLKAQGSRIIGREAPTVFVAEPGLLVILGAVEVKSQD